MQSSGTFWFWRGVWVAALLIALALVALYTWLPADGATGDLESFTPQGFRVQWLLEEREGGLRVEDIIVRAGGHTVDEWLSGASRGPEWHTGGLVTYEILRDGQPVTLEVRLSPVPFRAILGRWTPHLVIALTFLVIGAFVFWKRPQELAARLLMLFCVIMALQYLGDAYNFQYSTIPWRWPFWFHLTYEHGMYGLSIATICTFALVFPVRPTWLEHSLHLVPLILYVSFPVAILAAMALSPTWTAALKNGNHVSWILAMIQVAIAVVAGIRSIRTARDPVTRAQIRWIVWCAGIGIVVLVPGYVLPLMLGYRPLLPHPATMIFVVLIPFALAVAILRYRLFDIEVIINRTLVYGTLTLLLAGLYLFLVRLLTLLAQALSPQENESLVIFVAALSIALAFDPLRRRVQTLIDRTFYRTKLDTQRLLPEISARLATSVALDQLTTLLTEELPQRLQIAWSVLNLLDAEGKRFVPTGDGKTLPALGVDHPLIEYLAHWDRPLIRLQPPGDLPIREQEFLDEQGIELSIPLIVGTEQVGVYSLGPKLSGDAYSRDEVHLLQLMGQQAAVAVQNSRLFQETERQAEELAGLHEAAVAISSSLELEEVLVAMAEQLGRALNVSSVYICDFDEQTAQTVVRAEWISPKADGLRSDLGARYDMRQYPTALQTLMKKQSLVLRATDPDLDPSDRASAEKYGWHLVLIVPLVIRDRVIGYAELCEFRRGRTFTQAEIQLCETLAADAAAAIEHARLFRSEREQRKLAEALQEAADVVSRTLDLDQVLDRILEQVERVVAGDTFNVMLIEGDKAQVVRWRGYERLETGDQIAHLVLPIADYATLKTMVKTGKPLFISDTLASPDWKLREGWERLRSYLSAPIRVAGRTVGFLNVDGTRPGQFGPADAERLEAFAHHAATALENARLYAETQRQLRVQTALRQAGAVISSALDTGTVLSRMAESMGKAIDATSAYISSYESSTLMATVLAEYISPEACAAERVSDVGTAYAEDDEPEWLKLMMAGRHDVSQIDSPTLTDSDRIHMQQYGAKSILYIPLRSKDQFIGYAELWESRHRREFSAEEIALCQDIAQQAAIALEHARLYEQAQQEITERMLVEAQLKTSLAEKEVLIREIHHRVKNNLQVISSLLHVQSKHIEDPETLRMFEESRHRVRSMALVHERLYQTEDLSRVDLAKYVQNLSGYLLRSYGVVSDSIRLNIDVPDISLSIDEAIPCGLILNELVSNSLKHAFPDDHTGEIQIIFSRTNDDRLALTVSDDGIGIPEGLDVRNTKSLGLQLVNTLVEQLEGSLELKRGRGTEFKITFAGTDLDRKG